MDLSARTKIDDLLSAYPFLLEFFVSKSPKFKNLKNPIMRKTIGKVATLNQVAGIGKMDLEELLDDISREVKEKTGETLVIKKGGLPKTAEPLSDPKARVDILKGIIRDLHRGVDMEELKQRFQELIQHISPSEIAHMEQRLIEEGMPETEVKRLCDVHVAVFKEALEHHEIPGAPPGHPVHTFMKENRASEEIMDQMDGLLSRIGTPPAEDAFKKSQIQLNELLDRLSQIHIHYLRKENQLFPLLEAHDFAGPSQVMWAIHDDIRALVKKAQGSLSKRNGAETVPTLKELLSTVREMIYKEEHILYPTALELLSEAEWGEVKRGEEEIGYAWIKPEEEWSPGVELEERRGPGEEKINLDTGFITRELINLMLTHLPVDMTLVDEEDRVAYYSKGKERIFPRSPGIIGRKVQRCHPPSSVHIVNKLLDSFRAGERDSAEFWIQMKGRFIHIRYFALRDSNGTYKGCLEVSQDITEIRKLEGEKRLHDWQQQSDPS
jgi:DUF438 domain-containing protein